MNISKRHVFVRRKANGPQRFKSGTGQDVSHCRSVCSFLQATTQTGY